MGAALLWIAACTTPAPEAPVAAAVPQAPAPVEAAAPVDPPPVDQVRGAIDNAIGLQLAWLEERPQRPASDSRIGAHALHALLGTERTRALAAAADAALTDASHPLQRLFDPTLEVDASYTATWTVPAEGRVNPNRVLVEAAFCDDNGFRPASRDYACGQMRDDGGYHTAHAAWALTLARERGCLPADDPCPAELAAELLQAASDSDPPRTTLDADLLAERLLFSLMSGAPRDPWTPHVHTLLAAQGPDGGFGTPADGDGPYFRYHAAMAGSWALAVWLDGES